MKNKIAELRTKNKLTQDEFAKQLDVSRQTIISLEKERYNPSILLAYKIARIFSMKIEDVFLFEEQEEINRESFS